MIQRLKIIFVVILWLTVATLFYFFINNCRSSSSCSGGFTLETTTCGWNGQESFYYSVQAGLSIGFGLLSETNDWSRAFTVYHILAGSSFIGGALSLFISASITMSAQDDQCREEKLARLKARIHLGRFSEIHGIELADTMVRHPAVMREMLSKVEANDDVIYAEMEKFEALNDRGRRHMVIDTLRRAEACQIEAMSKDVTFEKLELYETARRTFTHRARCFIGAHRRSMLILCAFCMWLIVGIVYGMTVETWSFVKSVYFSIATMSTAGLQAVTASPSGGHELFAALYALVGVPVYGATLGMFANLLVEGYNEKRQIEALNARLRKSEAAFVNTIMKRSPDQEVTQGEYIVIQMLRHGLVDAATLTSFTDAFDKLDINKSGKISASEFDAQRQAELVRKKIGDASACEVSFD